MLDRFLARLGLCRTKNVINAATALRKGHRNRLWPQGVPATGDLDLLIRDREWVSFIRQAQGKD